MGGTPHIFGVTVYDTDGSTAKSDVEVIIRNESTNETQSGNTDSDGQYVFNLADFTEDWSSGDIISYFVSYTGYEASSAVTVTDTGGTTVSLTLVEKAVTPSLRYFTVGEFLNLYGLCTYEQDNSNGIKTEVLVRLGQQIESYIDNITYRKWDSYNGSYYTSTNEYQTVDGKTLIYFVKNTPIVTMTKVEVNTQPDGYAASWSEVDSDDLTINYNIGRVELDRFSNTLPEVGLDHIRFTYTYGQSSVPTDITRLAILLTAKALSKGKLQGLNIKANEISGLSSAVSITQVDDDEINKIIMFRQFPPIESI